jgi:hypothetical protein
MLVLTRKLGEQIYISDGELTVTVLAKIEHANAGADRGRDVPPRRGPHPSGRIGERLLGSLAAVCGQPDVRFLRTLHGGRLLEPLPAPLSRNLPEGSHDVPGENLTQKRAS